MADVYALYAGALGKEPQELTDREKQVTFLDAVLDGQQIEPFATSVEWMRKDREINRQVARLFRGFR